MNTKQKKTIKKIFEKPTPANIKWNDVISALKACGVEIQESASGSRVGFVYEDARMVLHKPHPGNELKKYTVQDVRDFLIRIEVTP